MHRHNWVTWCWFACKRDATTYQSATYKNILQSFITKIIIVIISDAAWKINHRTAYVGQTVRLPCRTTVNYFVDWRRLETLESDHAYIYSNGHVYPAFQSRFSIEITDSGDEYTLVIADVQLNDSAYYLCIEDAGLGNRHFFLLNVTGTRNRVPSHRHRRP